MEKKNTIGKSIVYQECSTRPWQRDTRELWGHGESKLLLGKVVRVNAHYEYPWTEIFDDYDAYGDDGWYYIGCTGPEQLFYRPVELDIEVGCSKRISYTSPDNEVFYADIVRAKKTNKCKEDEKIKYWYDDKWNGKYRESKKNNIYTNININIYI